MNNPLTNIMSNENGSTQYDRFMASIRRKYKEVISDVAAYEINKQLEMGEIEIDIEPIIKDAIRNSIISGAYRIVEDEFKRYGSSNSMDTGYSYLNEILYDTVGLGTSKYLINKIYGMFPVLSQVGLASEESTFMEDFTEGFWTAITSNTIRPFIPL